MKRSGNRIPSKRTTGGARKPSSLRAAHVRARKALEHVTPLRSDCGRLCDARCCSGGEEDGMLLFPGEETLYDPMPEGFRILDSQIRLRTGTLVRLLVCDGHCSRADRPLSCRIFPLIPTLEIDDSLEFRPDLRAALSCPLLSDPAAPEMDPVFIDALFDAFSHLTEHEDIIAFIEMLTEQNDAIGIELQRFHPL